MAEGATITQLKHYSFASILLEIKLKYNILKYNIYNSIMDNVYIC